MTVGTYSVKIKFGPAVRFREPIVFGSDSIGRLHGDTDKSRADDGVCIKCKKKQRTNATSVKKKYYVHYIG